MPDTKHGQPLSGQCIWVTRPTHQAVAITSALQALGATVISQPLLTIVTYDDPESQARLGQLTNFDLLIFVSANAVEFARPRLQIPANMPQIAAIGSATAAKCIEFDINVDFVPEQADSSGLLALPRFQNIQGQRVLIVRGRGGRAFLGEQLQQRGAKVAYAEVYVRQPSALAFDQDLTQVDVILITSSEALTNLADLANREHQGWVFAKQLLLIHERIAGRVRELGFTLDPLIAKQPSDAGMIETLIGWAQFVKERTSE